MPARLRRALIGGLLVAAGVVITVTLWQDQPVSGALLLAATLAGLATGSIFAIAASGIAISYATSGIFNFASGAIGMFMAFLYWELRVDQGWPALVCLPLVVGIAAPAFGAALDLLVMNRLRDAPLPQQLVATAGVMLALMGIAGILWPPNEGRSLPPFFGDAGFGLPGGLFFSWHRTSAIVTAVAVALALWLLLNHTRLGLSMRAVVSQPELAELYGVSSRRASMASWAIGSATAALAALLLAPEIPLGVSTLTLLIIDSFAAVVLGRFRNLVLVFAGGLFIGLLNAYAITFLDLSGRLSNLRTVIPTLVLFVALLLLPQARDPQRKLLGSIGGRSGGIGGSERGVRVPSLRGTGAGMAVLLLASVLAAVLLPTVTVNRLTQAMSLAILLLSLVLLTGWAGETSLAQLTFAGFGAFAMLKFAGDSGSPLGLVAATALGALIGLVVALPALRLHGIYLALASLAIARIAEELVFPQNGVLSSVSGGVHLRALSIAGWRVDSARRGLVLLTVAFVVIGVGLVALRRSRYGRRLLAMKDSPEAYEALGRNLALSRIAVYVLSAAIAGLGGALFALVRQDVGSGDFTMLGSLLLLLLLVVGGISSVGGALLGALLGISLTLLADRWPSAFLSGLTLIGPGLAALGVTRSPGGISIDLGEAFGALLARRGRSGVSEPIQARPPGWGVTRELSEADLDVVDDVLAIRTGTESMLAVEDVSVHFGGVVAVDAVSVSVPAGQIAGLVGPNGAGKSTLFDVICGTRRPRTGRILLNGSDVTSRPAYQRARLGISRTFQRLESFESLTVGDNVRTALESAAAGSAPTPNVRRRLRPVPPREVDDLLASLGLAHLADRPVSGVPTATARLVELARALAGRPRVLLLDEPSSGLTTEEVDTLTVRLRSLAASGVAVFVVAHDMGLVSAVCDQVHVMSLGKLIASGTPAQIRADARVRAAYLGEPAELPGGPAAAGPNIRVPAVAPVLEMRRLVAGYDGVPALHGVSLALRPGRVHAVLGPNGAGKSTLVRVAGGLLRPIRGSLLLCGRAVEIPAPHILARMGIVTVAERPSVFGDLSVAEHLRLGTGGTGRGGRGGRDGRDGRDGRTLLDRVFTAFPVLADHRDQPAGTLSGGEQQMLAVGRALALRPPVLIVDELSNGLAPKVVAQAYAGLRQIAAAGTAVLLVEQFVDEALAIADDATVLREGRVVFAGRAADAPAKLSRAYLGGAAADEG